MKKQFSWILIVPLLVILFVVALLSPIRANSMFKDGILNDTLEDEIYVPQKNIEKSSSPTNQVVGESVRVDFLPDNYQFDISEVQAYSFDSGDYWRIADTGDAFYQGGWSAYFLDQDDDDDMEISVYCHLDIDPNIDGHIDYDLYLRDKDDAGNYYTLATQWDDTRTVEANGYERVHFWFTTYRESSTYWWAYWYIWDGDDETWDQLEVIYDYTENGISWFQFCITSLRWIPDDQTISKRLIYQESDLGLTATLELMNFWHSSDIWIYNSSFLEIVDVTPDWDFDIYYNRIRFQDIPEGRISILFRKLTHNFVSGYSMTENLGLNRLCDALDNWQSWMGSGCSFTTSTANVGYGKRSLYFDASGTPISGSFNYFNLSVPLDNGYYSIWFLYITYQLGGSLDCQVEAYNNSWYRVGEVELGVTDTAWKEFFGDFQINGSDNGVNIRVRHQGSVGGDKVYYDAFRFYKREPIQYQRIDVQNHLINYQILDVGIIDLLRVYDSVSIELRGSGISYINYPNSDYYQLEYLGILAVDSLHVFNISTVDQTNITTYLDPNMNKVIYGVYFGLFDSLGVGLVWETAKVFVNATRLVFPYVSIRGGSVILVQVFDYFNYSLYSEYHSVTGVTHIDIGITLKQCIFHNKDANTVRMELWRNSIQGIDTLIYENTSLQLGLLAGTYYYQLTFYNESNDLTDTNTTAIIGSGDNVVTGTFIVSDFASPLFTISPTGISSLDLSPYFPLIAGIIGAVLGGILMRIIDNYLLYPGLGRHLKEPMHPGVPAPSKYDTLDRFQYKFLKGGKIAQDRNRNKNRRF